MAKTAPREASSLTARVWQQRNTRSAILDAARRLAARDNAADLTLSRVADEANFSPNTVYAYFVNKSELMLAVVAEDLAALARHMRDVFPANEDAGAKDESRPEPAEESHTEQPEELHAPDARVAAIYEPVSDPYLSPQVDSEPAPAVEDEQKHLAEPVAATVDLASLETETHEEAQPVVEIAEAPVAEVTPEADVEPQQPAATEEEAARSIVVDVASETEVEPQEPAAETAEASVPEVAPEVDVEPQQPAAAEEDVAQPIVAEAEPQSLTQDVEAEAQIVPSPEPEIHSDVSPGVAEDREDHDPIARLQESIARLEARPVDAWLERRLRELERMIASLEEREGNHERTNGAASGLLEEALRGLQTRMEAVEKNRQLDFEGNSKAFGERMDASEKRQREMLGEVRTLTMLASSRLDALESSAQKQTSYAHFEPTPTFEPAVAEEVAHTDAPAEPTDASAEDKPEPSTETSYLSQARRSAMAAAAQSVAPPDTSLQRFASTMSSIKSSGSRYIIAGGIVLLVALLGVGLALKRQAAEPDATASSSMQIAATTHGAHAKAASMAPQIRVVSLARKGNVNAELLLGLEYLDGAGAAKNESEAAQWVSRAAAHGNAVAQYWLADLYANGRGVKADPALAMHWYEEAAMQGNRKAMHQLAVSYAEGWGATRNYAEAARWFSRAASLGYVDSAFNLGVLYERGLGMPQSLLDAYKWYSIAAAMGDKGSPPRLAVLKTQMNADDIASATQAAGGFTPDAMDQAANTTPQLAQLPKS